MGWTSYHATKYKKNGTVDRKAECDKYGWGDEVEVLKSAMVGTTYYAAVLDKKTEQVFAAVFLTKTCRDFYNFGYKDMDETAGPGEAKCPVSILALLTETDSEYARNWRERCRQYHADKKSPMSFANLPPGTRVIWTACEGFTNLQKGQRVELVKRLYGKRATWVDSTSTFRLHPKYVKLDAIEIIG